MSSLFGNGIIGAGAIMRQGETTTGIATAAGIRNVGVIGGAVGYGYFNIGVILTIADVLVLRGLSRDRRRDGI